MNTKIFLLAPLFLAMVLFSCDKDDESVTPAAEMSILETASATDDLSTLVAAVDKAGLSDALSGNGPFTVFAPTNDAFQALLDSDPSWNSLDDIPQATLESVLLFHVVSGEVKSSDLTDTYVNTLNAGPNSENLSLQVAVTGGVKFNGSTNPVTTDVDATNGVVHIVDRVMLPPAIPNLALNNASFSTLVAALTDSRHTTDYVGLLSGNGPFTVFAPTNDAFQALLDSDMSWNSLGDIPIATLEAVLNYHVLGSANVQSDELSNGQMIEMFSGDTLTVDLSTGAQLTTSGGQMNVNIIITDVQATNGVVHAVDQVLLP